MAVPVTTLDAAIRKFGAPAFCKIDVEGFERQVIKGLSSRIRSVCFEFTRENRDDAEACADRLASLGKAGFNFSPYDDFSPFSESWLGKSELFRRLDAMDGAWLFGDICVRLG